MLQQKAEQRLLTRREVQWLPILQALHLQHIDRKRTAANADIRHLLAVDLAPPDQRLRGLNQHRRMKRFREVAVGTEAEAEHLIHLIRLSGQHHDRRVVSGCTHLLQHLVATDPLHHHVEDHQLIFLFFQKSEGLESIRRLRHIHALAPKRHANREPDRLLIVHQ